MFTKRTRTMSIIGATIAAAAVPVGGVDYFNPTY